VENVIIGKLLFDVISGNIWKPLVVNQNTAL